MYVRNLGKSALVLAPAKVNLSLEVLFKRADGFHEIESIIAPVGIFDTIEFTPAEHGEIRLTCRWSAGLANKSAGDLPSGEKNLVWRAVALLRERAGVSAGADIGLIKRIPSAAGLGGASSDAAAALVAANLAWQVHWPRQRLALLAAEIGSDAAFFMQNGASICRGRGERIEKLSACRLHVVVVRPPLGLSTPLVYQACRPTDAPMSSKPLELALTQGKVADAARMFHNRLEEAAFALSPGMVRLRTEFSRQGLLGHQMSGSGSSYFGVCCHARQARRIASRLRARRLGWARAATTLAAPAAGKD
jgi:4-diphosphocytidyl-2-C-methyl-D-erythritol kinase